MMHTPVESARDRRSNGTSATHAPSSRDDWVFVSGTTGFDYAAMTIAEGVEAQAEQCLKNIEAALTQAGASFADVVRVHYILPDASEFPQCWPVLRKYFGEVAAGGDDDRRRPGRPAHAHRDRSDGAQVGALTARTGISANGSGRRRLGTPLY